MFNTNLDSLSALLDRLIVENIKLFHLAAADPRQEMQSDAVTLIRGKLAEMLDAVLEDRGYAVCLEARTFGYRLVENLTELVLSNCLLGYADRAAIRQALEEQPDGVPILQLLRVARISNERRAAAKHEIEELVCAFFRLQTPVDQSTT